MQIEQLYTGCLSQGAYYIESNGEAVVIDPLRETAPYLQRAKRDKATITYIFETHFHADFVSGHLTLSKQTGATIVFGPNASTSFDAHIAKDNEVFTVGDITITVLHTPGHTMESTTYLLRDGSGKEHAIFTGDTLFLGDVGRPDLAQKSADITQEQLAGTLFDSLRNKIMPLPNDVIVYPAHGAGSACGKNMMTQTVDTLGNQKQMNYALRQDMTKEEFIKEVTDGLVAPPAYFPLNAKMNKQGYEHLDSIIERACLPISAQDFEDLANKTGAIILDVRNQLDFMQGHIPNSIFIGIDGGFAPWVGALIKDVKQPILLVAPENREEEVIMRLSRVGFDNTLGFLEGGIASWQSAGKEIDSMQTVSAHTLKEALEKEMPIFDVRKQGEFSAAHVPTASHTPLSFINDYLALFPDASPFYLYCAGGYRSVIAASILKSRGIHGGINVTGGFASIKEAAIAVV
ncbi:MBL fold metallo-hydrolase [Flavobacteriaceae bacterium]|nr:MBL fold metallo-hydrolase [Flavobacteriaceae bacterium]MDB4325174.1 MBL fold metallo-hydrolase [Flavobacteriaceae bacterium]